MAATEKITIMRVGTEEAVRNIQDLKDNIVALKKDLAALDIGSEEYNKTLQELNVNQNALKDAMHYTTSETKSAEQAMDGIAVAARGAGESYNALVNRLKSLKEEWRATEDVARRNELGKQINEVNQKLKDLDASTGSFKRNVGDYEGAIRRAGDAFTAMGGGAARATTEAKKLKGALDVLSKHPIAAALGVVALAIYKVAGALKTSETNFNRVTNAMSVFQVIGSRMNVFIQKAGSNLAGWAELLGQITEKLYILAGGDEELIKRQRQLNLMQQNLIRMRRQFMEEDAEREGEIARLRLIAIDAENYSVSQREEAMRQTIKLQQEINGHNLLIAGEEEKIAKLQASFSDNSVEANNAIAAASANRSKVEAENANRIRSLMRELNKITKQARKDTKDDVDAVADSIGNATNQISAKAIILQEIFRNMSSRERWTKFLEEDLREFENIAKTDAQALSDEIDSIWEKHFEKEMERTEQLKKARVDMMNTLVSTASSILGSVADIYESLSGEDEKAARNTKAIRIAAAVIDTIAGAISAFTSAQSIPPPAGQIIGAANAAAVVAAGTANIAKIRATDISKNAGNSAASLSSFSSPTVTSSIPQTTIVRGAQDEAILNQMGKPSRVYILQSDIEAAGKSSRARVAESAFN